MGLSSQPWHPTKNQRHEEHKIPDTTMTLFDPVTKELGTYQSKVEFIPIPSLERELSGSVVVFILNVKIHFLRNQNNKRSEEGFLEQ